MTKKILGGFIIKRKILGTIFGVLLVVIGSVGVASADKPIKPVYATIEQVQQMIANAIAPINTAITNLGNRLSLVETAVTANTSDIQLLKNSTQKAEPGFNIILNTETSIPFAGNSEIDYVRIVVNATPDISAMYEPGTGLFGEYLVNVDYWAVIHAPDKDYNCKIKIYDRYGSQGNGDFGRLLCQFPPHIYPLGTPMIADVYVEYGGKVVKKTITINTSSHTY